MPSGTREAEFNYSDLKEVNALSVFFDGLLNQQGINVDMEKPSVTNGSAFPNGWISWTMKSRAAVLAILRA